MGSAPVDLPWLTSKISTHTAQGITWAIIDLIRQGELVHGAQLPTVRALAAALDVSPNTVAEAWRSLARYSMVQGNRRNGTTVTGPPQVEHPARYETVGDLGENLRTDLAVAAPDPALLPDLGQALRHATDSDRLNSYARETMTARLREAVAPTWPYQPEAWLAVGGGYEGVQLLITASTVPGDRIAVENPTSARLLDLVDQRTDRIMTVACDSEGPVPDSVRTALQDKPAIFIYQPRAHTPCGHGLSERRCTELAEIFQGSSTLIIEDDGTGDIAETPLRSIGRFLPDRTVLVRSYSKACADLRTAATGGPTEVLDRVRVVRSFGAGWTSRILQDAVAYLLTDAGTADTIATARETYRRRRELLADALGARGVPTANRDGLVLWVPVDDEAAALVTLAARGVAAAPGSRYRLGQGSPHLRVATSRIPTDPAAINPIADLLAHAAHRR